MNDNRITYLLKNFASFGVAGFASKVLVFLMVPFYTTVLSTDDFGISDSINTTVALLLPVFTICMDEAVLRFTIGKEQSAESVFSTSLISLFVANILLVIGLPIVIIFFPIFKEFSLLIIVLFLAQSIYSLFARFARGLEKIKISAIGGVVQTFSIVIINIILLYFFKLGIKGYLISFVIGALVAALYIYISTKMYKYWSFNSVDISLFWEMAKYSFPLVPNKLSWWLTDSASKLILLAVLGASATGVYSAANRIPGILTVVFGIFIDAWLLSAIKEYKTKEGKAFIVNMHTLLITFCVILCSFVMLLIKPISFLLLKGNFFEGWKLTPLLLISVVFGSLSAFLGAIYSANKQTYLYFISTLAGGIVLVSLEYLFLSRWGTIMVSISVLISYFIIWLIRYITTKGVLDWNISIVFITINICVLIIQAILETYDKNILFPLFCFLFLIIYNKKNICSIISKTQQIIQYKKYN